MIKPTPDIPDIIDALRPILREWVEAPIEIEAHSRLVEDLGFDSLDTVDVAMEVESKWEIDLETEDLESIKTIGDLAKKIREKVI